MKIFYVNEDSPTPQTIKVIAPFNFERIKWDKGLYGKVVRLPYADINIVHMLGAPINLFSWQRGILYPDFNKSKVFIVLDQSKQKTQLLITIYPQLIDGCGNTQKVQPVYAKFEVKLSTVELIRFKWQLILKATLFPDCA